MSFANFDLEAQRSKTKALPDSKSSPDDVIPQKEQNLLNQISINLGRFISASTKLDKLQQQLGTKRDIPQLRSDSAAQITQCNTLEIETNKLLNLLSVTSNNLRNTENSVVSQISIGEEKLRKECDQVFKNYHSILRNYNEKINSVVIDEAYKKNLRKNHMTSTSEQTPLLFGSSGTEGYTETQGEEATHHLQQQQQQQLQEPQISEDELAYHDSLIQQRGEAIENMHRGVQDINKIFKDLNEIVNEQGQHIDTIEDNLHLFANNNQLASNELTKADKYQKAKGKYTCILLVFLVVVLLIVLALIS